MGGVEGIILPALDQLLWSPGQWCKTSINRVVKMTNWTAVSQKGLGVKRSQEWPQVFVELGGVQVNSSAPQPRHHSQRLYLGQQVNWIG